LRKLLPALLEKSAVERVLIARKLVEKGVYHAALFHYSVAIRLKLQSILSKLRPETPHTCSIISTATLILQALREELELKRLMRGLLERYRTLLAKLDAAYRGIMPSSADEARRLCNESEELLRELNLVAAMLSDD
jgi:HEPN domain-containing protein